MILFRRFLSSFTLFLLLTALPASALGAAPLSREEVERLKNGPDLFYGIESENVSLLQRFLSEKTDQDPLLYPEKKITGYFGPLTKNAVVRLQTKYQVSPRSGYFGPRTKKQFFFLWPSRKILSQQ